MTMEKRCRKKDKMGIGLNGNWLDKEEEREKGKKIGEGKEDKKEKEEKKKGGRKGKEKTG